MRNKAVFSVFGRKLLSGKKVFYYQCYDAKGMRQWAKSTGLTKKTDAVEYCMKLFKSGLLIPEQKSPTFAEYTDGWWNVETSRYLKWRQLQNPITPTTIRLHKGNFETHIRDYFEKLRLDEITSTVIESWLLHMSEKNIANGKDTADENEATDETETAEIRRLKPQTINLAYRTFKLIIGEAVRTKMLKINPCSEVKELKEEGSKRDILTVEEVQKIFPYNWAKVWESELFYKLNRLAACTGMRIGEIQGLRCEYVFDNYIRIAGQYTRFGYVEHTKTKINRNIPISTTIRQELEELLQINGNGYVFSEDGGITPVHADRIRRIFDRALENIGISRIEKNERNLTFHSWRHFLNTLLRMKNVADSKVQAVTGHLTKEQTERYTHFDTRKFAEVMDVQTELLAFNEPKNVTKKTKQAKTPKAAKTKTVKKTEQTKKQKPKATAKKPVKKTTAKKKTRA